MTRGETPGSTHGTGSASVSLVPLGGRAKSPERASHTSPGRLRPGYPRHASRPPCRGGTTPHGGSACPLWRPYRALVWFGSPFPRTASWAGMFRPFRTKRLRRRHRPGAGRASMLRPFRTGRLGPDAPAAMYPPWIWGGGARQWTSRSTPGTGRVHFEVGPRGSQTVEHLCETA